MKAEREPTLIKSFPSARLHISLFFPPHFFPAVFSVCIMHERNTSSFEKEFAQNCSQWIPSVGVWWSITQLLRWRIDPGLSHTRLPALLISFLSFCCSAVVASIPKKKKKLKLKLGPLCGYCALHRPRVSFLSESLTFPWHLPTFVITRKRSDLTVYQKHGRKIKAVKCQMGAVHLASVAWLRTWGEVHCETVVTSAVSGGFLGRERQLWRQTHKPVFSEIQV